LHLLGQPNTILARQAFERQHSFRFAEVASRCLGRLDIRRGLAQPPFSDALLSHNPAWRPIVAAALGRDSHGP
jgi:hypothetical protein